MKTRKEVQEIIRKSFKLNNKSLRTLPHCISRVFDRTKLAEVFSLSEYKVGAEIGVRVGGFSRVFCQGIPGLKLYCIDPWEALGKKYPIEKQERYLKIAKERLKPFDVKFVRKRSLDAVKDFKDDFFDFVYIDGDHCFKAVMLDILHYEPKVRPGGVIACHDFYSGELGVVNAVKAFVESNNIQPWYVTKELSPTAFWVKS